MLVLRPLDRRGRVARVHREISTLLQNRLPCQLYFGSLHLSFNHCRQNQLLDNVSVHCTKRDAIDFECLWVRISYEFVLPWVGWLGQGIDVVDLTGRRHQNNLSGIIRQFISNQLHQRVHQILVV